MTNEELAEAIQQGETEKLSELWNNIDRLVCWKANRRLSALGDDANIEFTELYDTGYIALVKAVRTYKPDSGPFAGWFMFYLKNAFAEATGYRTSKQRSDPARDALSLNAPLQEDNDGTLEDTIPADVDVEETAISNLWQRELHNELEDILFQIGGIQAEVIRRRYYDNMPYGKIAITLDLPVERVRQAGEAAMQRLRDPEILKRLRPYYIGNGKTVNHKQGGALFNQRIENLSALRKQLSSDGPKG
ncbi:MAG TPA: sigma-70 family RNA polymerase sigma factor [Eubacteriales bacterium]|nr:sigma-70 family RNA polymerase sigma factor [Eubacteriales bacterium]